MTAQADAGYNFIKIYNRLPAEAFEAIIATAGERGLSVEGHVPTAVGLSSALASGMRAVEHYRGYNIATLHDSLNAVLDGGYRPNRAELAQLWAAGELSFDQDLRPEQD